MELGGEPAVLLPFEVPSTFRVIGSSASGKTTLVCRLIQDKDVLFAKPFRHFYWSCPPESRLPKCVADHDPPFTVLRGIPAADELQCDSLLVIDDQGREATQLESTAKLFSVVSARKCITVILIQHNLFLKTPVARDVALNTKYNIIFKNNCDVTSFQSYSRQLVGSGTASRSLGACYTEATKAPHSYLLVDQTQACPPALRFRTQLLPAEQADGAGLCVYARASDINELVAQPGSPYAHFIETE